MHWFDREFAFTFPPDLHPMLLERWRGLLPRVQDKLTRFAGADWTGRRDGSWSAQENLGHLLDLEELWLRRIDELLAGAPELSPADLQNTRTHEAGHDRRDLPELFEELAAARGAALSRLETLEAAAFARSARHPRLQQPMRLVDHLFFVAEHDDHHLSRIEELLRGS